MKHELLAIYKPLRQLILILIYLAFIAGARFEFSQKGNSNWRKTRQPNKKPIGDVEVFWSYVKRWRGWRQATLLTLER